MRGHTRLEVFRRADKLARAIDQATHHFRVPRRSASLHRCVAPPSRW